MPDFSGAQIDYAISFVFGAAVILMFASRRLDELVSNVSGSEFQVVRLLKTSAFAGSHAYRRALLFYVLMLLAIFAILCIMQPIVSVLMGHQVEGEFKFDSPAWPLGVALAVVGFIPAAPLFEQFEIAFRRLANRVADIPDRFLANVTRLEQAGIEPDLLAGAEHAAYARKYQVIFNLLSLLQFGDRDIRFFARSVALAQLYYDWTCSNQADEMWSQAARQKLGDPIALTKARYESADQELQLLITETFRSEWFARLKTDMPDVDFRKPVDPQKLASLQAHQSWDAKTLDDLRARWTAALENMRQLTKQSAALLVILSSNDSKPKSDGGLFDKVRQMLSDATVPAVINVMILALVVGAVATFFAVLSFLAVQSVLRGGPALPGADPVGTLISAIVSNAAWTAITIGLEFGAAALLVIAMRHARQQSEKYLSMAELSRFPAIQAATMLLWATILSFFVLLSVYVCYNISTGTLTTADALSDLRTTLGQKLLWSLVAGGFAVAASVLLDSRDGDRHKMRSISLALIVTFVASLVLIIGFQYSPLQPFFWHNVVATFAFVLASYLCLIGLLARRDAGANADSPMVPVAGAEALG